MDIPSSSKSFQKKTIYYAFRMEQRADIINFLFTTFDRTEKKRLTKKFEKFIFQHKL
jgi:hypothetical protein